jgi:hypothetical protein
VFAGPHVAPGGAPYVLRVAQRATRSGRPPALKRRTPAAEHARKLWHACAEIATSTRRLPAERGALWSGAMLVDEDAIESLATILRGSADAGVPLGVTAYLEEPRAPFSFV